MTTTRRDFLKGGAAVVGSAVLVSKPADATLVTPKGLKALDIDARKCPDCDSPMAECMADDVWTCLFCNNDKWWRIE